MGGRSSKKNTKSPPSDDPFYQMGPPGAYGVPPPYPYPPRYGPGGRYSDDPYDMYGYGPRYPPPTDSFDDLYGGPMPGRSGLGGPFGRGMSPWNYGNCYMGNTVLQMIPFMEKTISKIAQLQAMVGMGGMGGGIMPMMPCPPSSCCMPMCSPMMPCPPSSCCMPMCSPMIAAATPLPITCNPLIQSMCPMTPTNCCNWMSPSSFMSALSSGPMACRPPTSLQFPSNVGMVMSLPWGTPNPLLTPSSFGGFSPQYNGNGGLSCCCYYCTPPPPPPPPITYYPRPVCVPQPYPVPCPAPVPIPNVQQVPVPRCVPIVAPPVVADCNPCCPIPAGAPLIPSQGVVTLGTLGQSLVMRSNTITTDQTLFNDEIHRKPIRKTFDQSRRAKAERIATSLSNLGLDNTILNRNNSLNEFKYRIKSTRNVHIRSHKDFSLVSKSNDKYMSDSNLTTLDTLFSSSNKSKQKQYNKSKRYSHSNRHRNSSIYD